MNTSRLREDILANLDKLPERFDDCEFYSPRTGCACFYGWLAAVTSGRPMSDMAHDPEKGSPAWHILDHRYGQFISGQVVAADRIIRAAGGHPRVVADQILASLEPSDVR